MNRAPFTVGIPTYGRGLRLVRTLEYLALCDPTPTEVIVHVDQSDGELERGLATRFPAVRVLSSRQRVGPGGARHRCILAATQPFVASFDDDSWPVDGDFFSTALMLLEHYPRAAVLAASIYEPGQFQPERTNEVKISADYIGCGYVIRTGVYRQTSGHIDRPLCYGIEEVDLAMQLFALEWDILQCSSLRVYHDTQFSHHDRADLVAGTVQNVALRGYLRYPVALWPRALLQLVNTVLFMIKSRRFEGLGSGLWGIPSTLRRYSSQRRKLPADKIRSYLSARLKSPS
jgi:GT2 family glycosyltransferase